MKLKRYKTTAGLLMVSCLAFNQNPPIGKTGEANKKTEAEFKKTCMVLADAFAKKNIAEINKYINPKTGVYVITRPGAMDVFKNEKKLDAKNPFPFQYPYSDTIHIKKY